MVGVRQVGLGGFWSVVIPGFKDKGLAGSFRSLLVTRINKSKV